MQLKDRQISDADSIASLQRQQMQNLNKVIKDNRKIATHKTIGWAVGGFAVGVALPVLIYFIKH